MNKKNFGLYFLFLLVVLSSCEDEFVADNTNYYDNVTFGVKIGSEQQISSRSADESQPLKEITVKEISSDFRGKPLYLHTIVEDYKPQVNKTQENEKQSRGAIRDKDDVADMGVSGVIFDTDTWSESGNILYFTNEKVNVNNYIGSTSFYWPTGHENVRFFAYSPYFVPGAEGNALTNFSNNAGSPSFDYEVPDAAANQVDLLVASNDVANADYGKTVDLAFGHALTAVQFYVSDGFNNVTIKSMTLKGVKYKGTYQYEYIKDSDSNPTTTDVVSEESGSWDVVDDKKDFVIYSGDGKVIPKELNGSAVEVNGGDNILMLMPQDFSNEADKLTLEIVLIDNENSAAGDKTIPMDLTGVWEKGKHVKYEITTNSVNVDYTFKVENLASANIPFYGGKGNYRVQSYKTITNVFGRQVIEPVAWTVTDIPENYELPIGLNKLTGISGTTSGETYEYNVLPNISSSTHDLFLKDDRGVQPGITDLSLMAVPGGKKPSGRTTANCYIIGYPGYYMLPLVYGNALKEGNDNQAAYTTTNSGTVDVLPVDTYIYDTKQGSQTSQFSVNVLTNFVDHANGNGNIGEGSAITSPWITDRYTAKSASVVWEDEPCLVTEVELCDEAGKTAGEEGVGALKFIRFRIHEQSVCEGNALIAVKDANGVIMWSWHIWVSLFWEDAHTKVLENRRIIANYDASKSPLTGWTCDDNEFTMMYCPIGYCGGEVKTYESRNITVDFKQTESGTSSSFTISQNGEIVRTTASTPYYQWGRKDPLLPYMSMRNGDATTATKADKPYYYWEDNEYKQGTTARSSSNNASKYISWTIQNPDRYTAEAVQTINGTGAQEVKSQNWCKNIYLNLWNTNCNKLPMFSYHHNMNPQEFHTQYNELIAIGVTKTIYDPCPPGWEMPRIDVFSGVTYEGINIAPFYVKKSDMTSGYWTDTKGNKYQTQFYPTANASTQVEESDTDLGFYLEAMDGLNVRMSTSATNSNSLYMYYMGHRTGANGEGFEYGNFINTQTSAIHCVQYSRDNADATYFGVFGSRLCVLKNFDTPKYSSYRGSETYDYGILRPFSGSFLNVAFPIYPIKTGYNPKK